MNFLPDPRGVSLHLGSIFIHIDIHLYARLLRSNYLLHIHKALDPQIFNVTGNLLGQKKSHATSWDKKKSCKLLGLKKITQPLGTKNHATSWEKKKIPQNQNNATYWDKKKLHSQ